MALHKKNRQSDDMYHPSTGSHQWSIILVCTPFRSALSFPLRLLFLAITGECLSGMFFENL